MAKTHTLKPVALTESYCVDCRLETLIPPRFIRTNEQHFKNSSTVASSSRSRPLVHKGRNGHEYKAYRQLSSTATIEQVVLQTWSLVPHPSIRPLMLLAAPCSHPDRGRSPPSSHAFSLVKVWGASESQAPGEGALLDSFTSPGRLFSTPTRWTARERADHSAR